MKKNCSRGFTIIELLVVFTIMAILSTLGFAAFSTFNQNQTVTNAILNIKSSLQSAKFKTLSQENMPPQCVGKNGASCQCPQGQQFGGYKLLFCCGAGGGQDCPVCYGTDTAEHYELDLYCGANPFVVDSERFPTGVSVDGQESTSRSFLFQPLTGLVTGAGTIVIKGFGQTRIATVSATGVIQ